MAYAFHSGQHEAIRMLQCRVVANLFASSVRERFAIKGGLALQAVMGSERATADLDLDAAKDLPLDRLRGAVREAIAASLDGILVDVHVTEPKQTDTVCRWKIWGCLPGTSAEVHFKVEVSRRDALATPDDAQWCDWRSEGNVVEGVRVKAHRPDMLCFMKLKALLSPSRDAPRDIHDLNVLICAGYCPSAEAMDKIGDGELLAMADEAWGKVELMGYARFMSEVAPYLPPAQAKRVDEGFYDELRIRVGSTVEQWMVDEIDRRLGAGSSALPRDEVAAKLEARRCGLGARGPRAACGGGQAA